MKSHISPRRSQEGGKGESKRGIGKDNKKTQHPGVNPSNAAIAKRGEKKARHEQHGDPRLLGGK